jgi:hypothetical protein
MAVFPLVCGAQRSEDHRKRINRAPRSLPIADEVPKLKIETVYLIAKHLATASEATCMPNIFPATGWHRRRNTRGLQ